MVTSMDESRKTILIVDDSQDNLNVLNRILQDKYFIAQALSGTSALEKAQTLPHPDIILLDIMMPDMDGFEVLQKLKENKDTSNIPIIFVSALTDTGDEARGLELGAVDYIPKPYSVPVVRARVKTHLELNEFQNNLKNDVEERSMELNLTLEHLQKAYTELNQIHNQVRSSWIETIYRLTLAAEYKDVETEDHIKRVGLYTRELAAAMGMDQEFVETIYYSSPIHDIGKVGIPDKILLKPGNLTPEELETMKSHTTIGSYILEGSDPLF